jgi:hypothetical protein
MNFNNRKYLVGVIGVLILFLSAITYSAFKSRQALTKMPDRFFSLGLIKMDGRPVQASDADLVASRLLILYASVECGSCDEALRQLEQYLERDIRCVVVLSGDRSNVLSSIEKIPILKDPRLFVVHDVNKAFSGAFNVLGTPAGFLYEYGRLTARQTGSDVVHQLLRR